jgi:hypothetical protein
MSKVLTLPDKSADRDRAKDTGMAMVLICLLVGHFLDDRRLFFFAIVLLIVDMVWPDLFYYPSKVWFGLSHVMGNFVSRILLAVLFFLVVTPVGVIRRLANADPMKRKQWKSRGGSTFKVRDHLFKAEDVEQPY